ncbi:Protein CBG14933 [Caenorhabditis briggsae]|uniref:Protein CBG14933 n=1 Tax=Caenorhabditis briggsae TaxID=6238 RepID=A8XL13_CAEBR|nr:Protein CBG14933 [Caenorhabditis briggsae]CAP33337.2 Protein CBG14933 [Caenorhabditis briggsae]
MPVAIITGASSGIGKATALLLARNNYKVSLTGRNVKALNELAGLIASAGGDKNDVLVTPVELSSEEAPKTIIDATVQKFGRIDSLVRMCSNIKRTCHVEIQINSAGILRAGPVLESGIEVYDELMNVNVRSLVRLTRAALPHIINTKGTVVNVSSINGPCPFPNVTYYCMSKSAVDQFTKCLALEMAPNGVRVNAVCPGVTVTNLHRTSGQDETTYSAVNCLFDLEKNSLCFPFQFLERSKTTHALGRPGEANEVAEAIFFLASEKSSFTTGELLRVDGGRGIMHPR